MSTRSRGVIAAAVLVLVAIVAALLLTTGQDKPGSSAQTGVPAAAVATLQKIDEGTWPDSAVAPGTKGGDRFGNRERQLPTTDGSGRAVGYREWDVNPKQRGKPRDAQRIVTGSDGSAWYTGDHYTTFVRMR
ncbi:ribonuclease T1 [Rhodococcus sp. PvR044]|jgi:ribonuclease T1|uniref:ribonuclease domain-containing protein n=1 Tax=unclassified Rhodococcus (in: high G+C Gram-positive bacteria) TaxID=192944 RepID=UPI000BCFDA03|nr:MULTISPECIES: ribonuclease domain-containing protein [unclassified Rhodococcus (in: high G+C Gram-positive bacteria)]PTR44293.1 ribonuclease [Rhodococcus sp. OK611]SNX89734.1 ribonuclease [Rhodococcus sp. OK270]